MAQSQTPKVMIDIVASTGGKNFQGMPALSFGYARREKLEDLDLSYAPPFAPVYDPVLIAATVARKRLHAAARKDAASTGRGEQ